MVPIADTASSTSPSLAMPTRTQESGVRAPITLQELASLLRKRSQPYLLSNCRRAQRRVIRLARWRAGSAAVQGQLTQRGVHTMTASQRSKTSCLEQCPQTSSRMPSRLQPQPPLLHLIQDTSCLLATFASGSSFVWHTRLLCKYIRIASGMASSSLTSISCILRTRCSMPPISDTG